VHELAVGGVEKDVVQMPVTIKRVIEGPVIVNV
jgi:hypothetical protein